MQRQETAAVGIVDVGKAFWRGDVTLRDVSDGVRHTQALSARSTRSVPGQGATLSERLVTSVTGTFLAEGEGLGGRSATLFTSADKKRRKTVQPSDKTGTDHLDSCAEHMFVRLFEQPVCLEGCMEYPVCQRACHPAEYATRRARQNDGEAESNIACANFGLPSIGESGYSILSNSEVKWHDAYVPERLGLSMAIHCKTSARRLCLIQSKSELPSGVSTEQVKKLMRTMRRCEHANVLHCLDFFEDETALYFMYEDFPCITLQRVMELGIPMNQEEVVNTARECFAAAAFASTMGMLHLGWSYCHVLMPAGVVRGDMTTAKVFGFGLMGVITLDSPDHACWSPEALEKYSQTKDGNFILKLETQQRPGCDSWSLGCIAYGLAAKAPPFPSEQDTMRKTWTFSIVFDEIDPEAKSLIEGFLYPLAEKRLRSDKALHHEWIRRRWRPPPGGSELLHKVEEFCNAPLAKRLFGRFLTRHLEAEHFRKIAKSFAALDISGSGCLSLKELQIQTRLANRPPATAERIFEWLRAPGSSYISLNSFAESLAEHVADGPALRMAFESLDEDGSEEVSAEELWEVLSQFDKSITVEDVKLYIQSVEDALREMKDAEGWGEEKEEENPGDEDGVLSYNEFVNLFPERTARIDAIESRVHNGRQACAAAVVKFRGISPAVQGWTRGMEQERKQLEKLCGATATRTAESAVAALAMKKHFTRLKELLYKLPGPEGRGSQDLHDEPPQKEQRKGSKGKANHVEEEWGWETFIQQQAQVLKWKDILSSENKQLKQALMSKSQLNDGVDTIMANDAASNTIEKVAEILLWCRLQVSEYEAFTEANDNLESLMPAVSFSARGLRMRSDQEANRKEDDAFEETEKRGNRGFFG